MPNNNKSSNSRDRMSVHLKAKYKTLFSVVFLSPLAFIPSSNVALTLHILVVPLTPAHVALHHQQN